MTIERQDERATLATYYDLLEAATNTALDLIRAARSLPGGGRRLLPSGRVAVTRDVGDARDGAVVRPRLALLMTAMTEDLPPPPHASPQTLPVPGGPLPHATREEEEEAASPPVPQVPPPEPPSVHASAHHGAPLSPPQVPPRASSAPASMPAAPTTAATGTADAATVATKSAAAARLRCLIASQENGASPHPLDGFGVAPRVHARPPWRPPTRLACGTGAVVGAMVGGGNQGAMVGGGYEGADGKDGGAGGDEGDEGAVVGGCGGRIAGRRGGRGAGRGGRGGRGASACTVVHLPGASAAAASSAPSMTWEIVEIEASHIIALSTLRLNVPQSLATATALDLASVGAETGAHHGAALLKLAQQLSLLQRKHRFLPVPLIDPIADVHLSAQPISACEVTAAAAAAAASASASASAAAAAAAAAAPAAAPAEKGRGGRSGRGRGVVVGGRGGRGGRGVSVTAKVAMGATDGAAGAEVGGSSRVGDDGAVVGESDGGGAGYPSPLAAMVARLSRSLQEHRSALQAHPYSSHAEIAILISAEAQRRALLGEIAEIDRVRLRDCEIARWRRSIGCARPKPCTCLACMCSPRRRPFPTGVRGQGGAPAARGGASARCA